MIHTPSGEEPQVQSTQEQLMQSLLQVQEELRILRNDQITTQNTRTTQRNQGEVAAVSTCKLSSFWKNKPHLWFWHAESQFQTQNLRSDNSKYHTVIASLDETALEEISDVLADPPETDKYTYLKTTLIKRFTDSSERQLQKLLTELELGDKKPSQLLRIMKDLAQDRASDELIQAKWLGLLHNNVHNILKVVRGSSVNELADIADSIMENNSSPYVMATSRTNDIEKISKQQEEDQYSRRLRAIERRLDELASAIRQRPQSTFRHRSHSRGDARRRSYNNDNNNNNTENKLCFYHKKFGDAARKCVQPCTHKTNNQEN